MVREWTVAQCTFLVEKKMQGAHLVVRAVFKMKDKARACVAVDGGSF